MKGKVVFRVAKIKSVRALRGALAHNLRVQDTPNADPTRTQSNQIGKGMNTITDCMARYDKLIGSKTVRKNAVHAIEVVVSGSPEVMNEMTAQERTQYFQDSLNWLHKEFGGRSNLVSFVVHNDESTPHLQAIYTPMIDGKLNARAVIGGHRSRLSEMQTDFAAKVSEKYGLERGVKGSKATHTTIKEYAALTKDLEEVRSELAVTKLELTNVKSKLRNSKENVQRTLTSHFQPLIHAMETLTVNMGLESLRELQIEIAKYDKAKLTKQIELPGQIEDDFERAIKPFRRT
jgi:hypothetical protein